ncbi:hypothetical protein [Synechococcus phage S-MS29]|nr:hypothetical protein [Synechococcus phage S-MS29]
MLQQFGEKFKTLSEENQRLAAKIKENEVTMLKLQGAIETLEYYKEEETASAPPDEVNVE